MGENFHFLVFSFVSSADGEGDDDGLERPETKDVLSSGSASPSSTHSLEGASPLQLVATTTATVDARRKVALLRNQTPQSSSSSSFRTSQQRQPSSPVVTVQPLLLEAVNRSSTSVRVDRGGQSSDVGSPTSLMDSHDDVEHRIPATLIHDRSAERWVLKSSVAIVLF